MAKRGKTNDGQGGSKKVYWQSGELNLWWRQFFRKQLIQLALARFRWVNLPKTCDERYLEMQLLFQGMATLAQPTGAPGQFLSLRAVPEGINMYGNPPRWRAQGDNGTDFECDSSNAVMIYDNMLRAPMAGSFNLLAFEMADIVRTKQINRQHCKTPFVFTADQQYRQQLVKLYDRISDNEPAFIGTRGLNNINVDAIKTGVQFMGKELQEDLMATWNMAFTFLGISNLPFKSERQTADEVKDYGQPTELLTLNPLSCRRSACDKFNDRFGTLVYGKESPKKLSCVWNEDFESDTFNTVHNLAKMMGVDDE